MAAGWIEQATARHKGAYGHHSKAQTEKDAKAKGTKGKRARLALTLESFHKKAAATLYPKK